MKKVLLCMFGFHKYKQLNENIYYNDATKRLAIPSIKARRVCIRCGKLQEQEIHCLGLNPPQYIKEWYDRHKSEII